MLLVSNANYANCNGRYRYEGNLKVGWAPLRYVYKHLTRERYVFWRPFTKSYPGWAIGPKSGIANGGAFHLSKLHSHK